MTGLMESVLLIFSHFHSNKSAGRWQLYRSFPTEASLCNSPQKSGSMWLSGLKWNLFNSDAEYLPSLCRARWVAAPPHVTMNRGSLRVMGWMEVVTRQRLSHMKTPSFIPFFCFIRPPGEVCLPCLGIRGDVSTAEKLKSWLTACRSCLSSCYFGGSWL